MPREKDSYTDLDQEKNNSTKVISCQCTEICLAPSVHVHLVIQKKDKVAICGAYVVANSILK